jgi:hypothetical protein
MKFLMMLTLCVLCVGSALSATYYVDQTNPAANDGNSGAAVQPWKTLTHAGQTAQSGDVVLVKQGDYAESIKPTHDNVTFQAAGDDHVVIRPPVLQTFDPAGWQKVPGTRNVYQCSCAVDTNDCKLHVDGVVVEYMVVKGKVVKGSPIDGSTTETEVNSTLKDENARRWTNLDGGLIQINLNGDDPAKHRVELTPSGFTGIDFKTKGCHVKGFEIHNAGMGISFTGDENIAEDCLIVKAHEGALFLGGRADVLRRCTLLQPWVGINAGDSPGQLLIEDNFIIGAGYPDWRNYSPQEEIDNPWRMGCGIRFGNIGSCVLRHNIIADGAWAGWWPDVNCYSNYFYGNTMSHLADRGIYNEYPSNGSQILYNAVVNCNDGITSRFAWHTLWMYNYLADNKNTGFALWGPHIDNPYLFDNVVAKNIVTGSHTCLTFAENGWLNLEKPGQHVVASATRFRSETNNLIKNLYQLAPGGQFADFDGVKRYATLAAFQKDTGMEMGSKVVKQPSMEDLSLRLFTVRVPESSHQDDAVAVVGNPVRQGIHIDPLPLAAEDAPYFWYQGDAAELNGGPVFGSAYGFNYQWERFGHPVRGLIRAKAGADPAKPLGAKDDPQVWLECLGSVVDKIPADGEGFWSPTLPTVPGAHISFTFQLSGDKIKPTTADGGPVAYIRFQTLTGQHVQRVLLFGKSPNGTVIGTGPMTGAFPWRTVHTVAVAPADAKRFAIFFGLKPASGAARYANLRLETLPVHAPVALAVWAKQYVPIKLDAYFNHALDKDAGGAAGAPIPNGFILGCCSLPTLDLSKIKPGMHTAGNVPFQVSRAVTLRSYRRPPLTLPLEANGIPIAHKVTALYFLHPGPTHYIGREYWRYIVHYADGSAVEVVPVEDAANLHYYSPYFLPDASEIEGAAPTTGTDIAGVLRWVNPRPDVAVASVDFRSMDNGQSVLLGITAAVVQ